MLLAILFQFSVATVVIIGDSVERFMLHAAAHEGLNPACRSERPVIPHSAISTMACGDFFFMHNGFDIATKGPLHRFGSVFEGRPVQQADLLLAMKAAPDNVTRVQLAVNFWTLARLRSHHRPTLLSMETSNAVALTFRAGLDLLMATVERRYPNVNVRLERAVPLRGHSRPERLLLWRPRTATQQARHECRPSAGLGCI